MKNLRVRENISWVSDGGGESQRIVKYDVVRDIDDGDWISNFNLSQSVIEKGITIETMNSKENAELLITALTPTKKG